MTACRCRAWWLEGDERHTRNSRRLRSSRESQSQTAQVDCWNSRVWQRRRGLVLPQNVVAPPGQPCGSCKYALARRLILWSVELSAPNSQRGEDQRLLAVRHACQHESPLRRRIGGGRAPIAQLTAGLASQQCRAVNPSVMGMGCLANDQGAGPGVPETSIWDFIQ